MSGPFTHLHCHTHYSLLDGASRVPELVAHVKGLGMNACAVTDHGNLFAAVEFYQEARKAGINPILGYEAYVAHSHRTERAAKRRGEAGFHLTLLAKNAAGFKNLMRLASAAYLEGFHYVPRIDKELLEAHHDGLVCLSGCASAEFSDLILKGRMAEATALAEWFAKLFGKDFYIEVQNNGLEIQRLCAQAAVDIASRLGLPLVATSDAHYLRQTDAPAHDVLLCINTGKTLDDPDRMRYGNDDGRMVDQFFVCGPEEMYRRFPGHAEAVRRSQEIADGCDIRLDLKARHFPVFTPPPGRTAEEHLRDLALRGLAERYGTPPPPDAAARLERELDTVCRMGFAGYFLIVWDFVRFARERGIPSGARGSACGAVLSYCLYLSHVEPLTYDLLFERFLDPNRSEAPDIDMDFCKDRREEVLGYVRAKYGAASVAQIITFGTLAARAAIKDVARALDLPLADADRLAKWVPDKVGTTIDEALKQSPELAAAYRDDSRVHRVIDVARTLEGTNRSAGTHAAGVVIAAGPLVDYVPLYRPPARKGAGKDSAEAASAITTQWGMNDLEKVGMLKMDFLGLRTLTVLDACVRLIERTRGERVDVYKLPPRDPDTFALMQRGDTQGVFQFESDGIRELLKRLRPDSIHDLVAATALYRPGPLGGGMVDNYVNRKHGREVIPQVHPVFDRLLTKTYGVLCYQEQVMTVLNQLGGLELSAAYGTIKAISKKKQDVIDQRRAEFMAGATQRALDAGTAQRIFDLIAFFGGYGFNACLTADARVLGWHGGSFRVGDLAEAQGPAIGHVHALADDGRFGRRAVPRVYRNGRQPVFTLVTGLGRRLTGTANHRIRVPEGWQTLGTLQAGDHVAAPRRLTCEITPHPWSDNEIVVLAGLLSEGNTCHPTTLYFYNNDRVMIDDFARASAVFPDTVASVTKRPNRRCLEARLNLGSRWRTQHTAVAEAPQRCGAFRWAGALGLLNARATAKYCPDEVYWFDDDQLALFLGRLWAGDGFICTKGTSNLFYATSSRRLADDVQTLLLRLGVISGIHVKQFRYRGGYKTGYTVNVVGDGSAAAFCAHIGPHVVGKTDQVANFAARLQHLVDDRHHHDLVPVAPVRALVQAGCRRLGLGQGDLAQRTGLAVRTLFGSISVQKRGFSRTTVRKLADALACAQLHALVGADVYWDRVVSVEPAGVADTYDLTVDGDHNYVAEGIVVHNSHATAYALVSYQTAFLKTHFLPEFTAALLTSNAADRDLLVAHIADARRLGVDVAPPDVNASELAFTVRDGRVVFGLAAIKDLGEAPGRAVVDARADGGRFRDLTDWLQRTDLGRLQPAHAQRLVEAGACDSLLPAGGHRAQLSAALPTAYASAKLRQKDGRKGQGSLFDAVDDTAGATLVPLPEAEAWSDAERLRREKAALDLYLSSHPLARFEAVLKGYASCGAGRLAGVEAGRVVLLGGMVTQLRLLNTKQARNGNPTRYARFKVEDASGTAECVMWPDVYARLGQLLVEDQVVWVRGTTERSRDETGLIAAEVMDFDSGRRRYAGGLALSLGTWDDPGIVDRLKLILGRWRGPAAHLPVYLVIGDDGGRRCQLRIGDDFTVDPERVEFDVLTELLGPGRAEFVGRLRRALPRVEAGAAAAE